MIVVSSLFEGGACFVCSWSLYIWKLSLKRKELDLESVIEVFKFVYVCVCASSRACVLNRYLKITLN